MEEATQDIVAAVTQDKNPYCFRWLQVDNIDVFCEKGVFDLNSTRCILKAGKDMGLNINFHGDELHNMNSAHVSMHTHILSCTHMLECWNCLLTYLSLFFVHLSNSLGQNLAL